MRYLVDSKNLILAKDIAKESQIWITLVQAEPNAITPFSSLP
jgi:hypothetical protein